MKKTIVLIIILCLTFPAECRAMSAKSYVLIDAGNGRILYSQNENEKLPMASTTKIMTALVAIENSNPDDIVTVSKNASNTEGSSIYLKSGEKVSMRELLYGLMLDSGNDAAVAIAEHISGGTEAFANKMTQKAKDIGAVNTSFRNPNGLDAQGHYTTAKDLAIITREALNMPLFSEIVKTKSISLSRSTYTNHNKLLSMYDGITGVKTGFTKKCGRCLVSSCTRGGFNLIAVTLNDPDDWNDHIYLYDKAFAEFKYFSVISNGQYAGQVKLDDGNTVSIKFKGDISAYLNSQEKSRVSLIKTVPDVLPLPVKEGEYIGYASASAAGVYLGKCDIVSAESREVLKKTFKDYLFSAVRVWLSAF